MSITVQNLSKQFAAQKAVNAISFTIGKGEIVGFLGPNGAGKSTTMKMITGYLEPDAGSIQICGIPVVSGNDLTRKKIGYLPEANPLYTEMFVREYLLFISRVHQIKQPAQTIESIIETVGLTPEANKKIAQLSKGYKQRVGLAAALLHDPEVLILDEPTSGLDPNQIIEIREVIRRLGQHKTVLFSSHIMQEVEAICNRVIIINKGNIVADDSIQNLQKQATGIHQVVVSFKQSVSPDILHSIPGLTKLETIQQNRFLIHCKNSDEMKKHLVSLSIEKNLDIESLQSENQNLEMVFKSLTT